MGGIKCADEVEDRLAGRYENLYFDTGVVANYISDEKFLSIAQKQGADKILFGSDCPWDHPENEIVLINRMPFTDEERELIFHKNAEKLVGRQLH